jgi:23S rRNA (guanosine2251-2'-O)-methyltransferase
VHRAPPSVRAQSVDVANAHVYGVHAARTLLEKRPGGVLRAKLLAEAGTRLAEIRSLLEALGVPVHETTRGELDRLAEGGAHQGVVLETRSAVELALGDFEALVLARGRAARLLVLDGVEDPRNLGACLRTADAAGVDALLVPRAHSAALTPAAQKAATGAAETVPVVRVPNLARCLRWLKEAGVWIVGADSEAQRSLYEATLAPPIALVLGGENRGLRRLTRELCDELVSIPMRGTVASLNVSVAAGVLLFELDRQAGGRGSA